MNSLLTPELLRRLEQVQLLAARRAKSSLKGERRSRARGLSVEFADHRNYVLGDDLRYTPDFIVQKMDGSLEVEEVKGFWRDDARAKIKMFATLYPFPVRAYTKAKTHSGWDVETFR